MVADSSRCELATLEQLVDLAGRSMLLRVAEKNHLYPGWQDNANGYTLAKRNHPYLVLNDSVLHEMRRLGRVYRSAGQDLRASAFWPLLKHRDAYVEVFEYRRHVALKDITPRSLYDHLKRGNRVTWEGWLAFGGRCHESQDDFGQPVWRRYYYIRSPEGEVDVLDGLSKAQARHLYLRLVGEPFGGVDDLGFDLPHPAENVPAWMINPDGSLHEPSAAVDAED